jgi:hypothetical protein
VRKHADPSQIFRGPMAIASDIPARNVDARQVFPTGAFEARSLGDETTWRLTSANRFKAVDNRGRNGATDADEQQAGSGGIGTHRELTRCL